MQAFRHYVILCFALCAMPGWIGCGGAPANQSAATAKSAKAIAEFYAGMEATAKSKNDTVISLAVRRLYAAAPPETHDTIFAAVNGALKHTLLFNTSADTGLMPFYIGLSADTSLRPKNRAIAALNLANYQAHMGRNADSADAYLSRAGQHQAAFDDTMRDRRNSIQAQVYQLRGQLKEAITSLYQCIAWSEKVGDTSRTAANYGNLANVYRGMGDFRQAVKYRQKALADFIILRNESAMATSYGGIAADLSDLNLLDSARPYMLAAEALFDRGVQSPVAQYYLYLTKGGMYVTLKKFDSAIRYFDRASSILRLFNDPGEDALFATASVLAYVHTRRVDKEVKLIETSIPATLAGGDLQTARDAYEVLYQVSQVQPTGTTPLAYFQRYDSLRTLLADQENRKYVAEMDAKYEGEKKALQIQVQQKELKQKSTMNVALLLSLLAAALLAGIILARMQLLRTRREAAMQQQFTTGLLKNTEEERSRIAAELHDSISHELLALKNTLHTVAANPAGKVDEIINDVRRISRNLHPVMLDKIGLEASIRHLCEQLTESGKLFVTAEVHYPRRLPADAELQVFRIVQESLTNVVKYAGAVAARVTLTEEESGSLSLTVEDNGKGFDVAERLASGKAFGLHSLLERGKVLGGRTVIQSSAQGTVVQLRIPV